MKTISKALIAGVAALLLACPVIASPASTSPVQSGEQDQMGCWYLYGRYRCYCDACDAAEYLQNCGHCTRIVYRYGYYEVWYK
jgi:hypothetical protein